MTSIPSQAPTKSQHVSVPLTRGLTSSEGARLCFDNGLENIDIRAAESDTLLEADFGAPHPTVWADDTNVHVEYSLGSRLLRRASGSVLVNSGLLWALDVHGGADHLTADFSETQLRSLAFHSGAAHVHLVLARPARPCMIRLAGASRMMIERPADVPVRLEISGGASRVNLDDRWTGAVGRGLVDHTGDLSLPGYTVIVAGGADRLSVIGRGE